MRWVKTRSCLSSRRKLNSQKCNYVGCDMKHPAMVSEKDRRSVNWPVSAKDAVFPDVSLFNIIILSAHFLPWLYARLRLYADQRYCLTTDTYVGDVLRYRLYCSCTRVSFCDHLLKPISQPKHHLGSPKYWSIYTQAALLENQTKQLWIVGFAFCKLVCGTVRYKCGSFCKCLRLLTTK